MKEELAEENGVGVDAIYNAYVKKNGIKSNRVKKEARES